MIAVVRCIVLHTVKYGDSGLIIKCLTEDGLRTFFIASYLKNNRNKYPFLSYPLSIAECEYISGLSGKLPKIKSLSLDYVPRSGSFDFRRQAMATFMAECAMRYIREESMSEEIFNFMEQSIHFINESKNLPATYPVRFGFELVSLLGFGIGSQGNSEEPLIFTLDKGFVPGTTQAALNLTDSGFLKEIISSDANSPSETRIPSRSLKNIFQAMLMYFRFHFPETATLKSPEILHLLME
ncbi:MAG: hypothetical protein A2W93_07440 [Bacteroidetes bacterium GWF2_43_63]|nr:MAG: hypothetical protein A2W94_15510 [Bacteroidetes bacterium GWE2_42_42]OFY54058.1 MAG: hypothetical protein A2W93_07440 [Bacteroidetes bacterium GWF2_43_63]HCB63529.1 hypothetical protein [Bacteroidales bacterium]HCY23225.1 hypothetical protein [Bacteroidales bacterium]